MVTGAALATINRLPVLLLPGDVFATRAPGTVLQELEDPTSYTVSVNDTLRPVSKFWTASSDRSSCVPALLAAMRVLTDPAETGAVTLALPQDVQAEAFDWPDELFERRVWRVRRPLPEPDVLAEAAALIRARVEAADRRAAAARSTPRRPTRSRRSPRRPGIGVGETQAGKGSLPYDHPQALGAIGATGTTAANAAAREADVVLGVGTRWSDFTTASRSLFSDDAVFINLNVATVDAFKHAGAAARRRRAARARGAHRGARRARFETPANDWDAVVERRTRPATRRCPRRAR